MAGGAGPGFYGGDQSLVEIFARAAGEENLAREKARLAAEAKPTPRDRLEELILGSKLKEQAAIAKEERAKATIAEMAAQAGLTPAQYSANIQGLASFNPEAVPVAKEDPIELQKRKALASAQTAGFYVSNPEEVIPSQKGREEIEKISSGYKSMMATSSKLKEKLSSASWKDRLGSFSVGGLGSFGTGLGKEIDMYIGALLMQAKNLEDLGALQGPEIKLMERIQGGITGVGSLLQDKEQTIKRLEELMSAAKIRVVEAAKIRGYSPKGSFFGEGIKSQAEPTATGEPTQQPLQQTKIKQPSTMSGTDSEYEADINSAYEGSPDEEEYNRQWNADFEQGQVPQKPIKSTDIIAPAQTSMGGMSAPTAMDDREKIAYKFAQEHPSHEATPKILQKLRDAGKIK